MKLLLAACLLFSFVESSLGCQCYTNQTIDVNTPSITITAPTTDGKFNSPSCGPIICTTTVTITGTMPNGLPAGATLTFLNCNGISPQNKLTYNGREVTSCPPSNTVPPITDTNVLTVTFNLTTGIKLYINVKPSNQLPPTTAAPTVPTTTPYSGGYNYNPATARMDLTIGLDVSTLDFSYNQTAINLIYAITKDFTYSNDYVRLSFITFDPIAQSGTGPLWSYTADTLKSFLVNSLPYWDGGLSQVASMLNSRYFTVMNYAAYAPRPNTQRVFIIFTGSDAMSQPTDITTVKANIDTFDVKFVYINLNLAKPAGNTPSTNFPNLAQISGTDSNKAQWYDYHSTDSITDTMNTLYYTGNNMCNTPDSSTPTIIPTSISPTSPTKLPSYSLPTNDAGLTKNYCNYMKNKQQYQRQSPDNVLRLHFSQFNVSNEKDYVRINTDGNEISVLTGVYNGVFYCLNATLLTVSFESRNGLIYSGYTSDVRAYSTMASCEDSSAGTYIKV